MIVCATSCSISTIAPAADITEPSAQSAKGYLMADPRYIVLFGACLTQFTVIGMLFSFGLFLPSFEAELGWSRTFLSSCTALAFFIMGVLALDL